MRGEIFRGLRRILDLFLFAFLDELGFVPENLLVIELVAHGPVQLLVGQGGRSRSRLLNHRLVYDAGPVLETLFLVTLCELPS